MVGADSEEVERRDDRYVQHPGVISTAADEFPAVYGGCGRKKRRCIHWMTVWLQHGVFSVLCLRFLMMNTAGNLQRPAKNSFQGISGLSHRWPYICIGLTDLSN